MKLGTENKKQLMWLGGLLAVLAVVLYTQVLAPGDDVPARRPAAQTTPGLLARPEAPSGVAVNANAGSVEVRPRPPLRGQPSRPGFRPAVNVKNIDPATIDPTLRLDLLAKVQAVTLQGGERNLFQFGAAPLPKQPERKIIPAAVPATPAPDAPPAEPPKPPPPPIPLKFYGYAQSSPTQKRAFFLLGEDILIAGEGEVVKNRYKIIRLGVNSVIVEDTEHQNQQTLPLEEPKG